MDYKGQDHAEVVYQVIMSVFGVVAFCWGYVERDLTRSFHVWCVGLALASVITLPPWPCFKKNPVKWLEKLPDPRPEKPEPKRHKTKKGKRSSTPKVVKEN